MNSRSSWTSFCRAAQPILFDALTEESEGRCCYSGYEFTVQYRRTWTYSEQVCRDEEELKARKKWEERSGIAERDRVTGYVLMKAQAVAG